MKKLLFFAMLTASLLLGGCDWLLDVGEEEDPLTRITADVDFVATSATYKYFPAGSQAFTDGENFTIEMLGDADGIKRDAMILDLVAPKDTALPVGTFKVDLIGDYLAMPRYEVRDENYQTLYSGGSFYGKAVSGSIRDYFAFLTGGSVTIAHDPESDTYSISVDANSGEYSIKVTYNGKMTLVGTSQE
ncbi:MAG: hypothetical protein J6U53_06580 [Tidjanibacter sp.]|nr:hypothetical protein [Tidjanibacter sp.]